MDENRLRIDDKGIEGTIIDDQHPDPFRIQTCGAQHWGCQLIQSAFNIGIAQQRNRGCLRGGRQGSRDETERSKGQSRD